jgi:isoleucyl-tRNA synthetase
MHDFCIVDLSAFYFDVLKDRLYTFAPHSKARRSAQTAIWRIGEALVRLLAPVMSFTADEIWQYLPKLENRPESVHLALFPAAKEITGTDATAGFETFRADWETLLAVRQEVLKALESARNAKTIGSSLEAHVQLSAPESVYPVLERYRDDLRALFITSAVTLVPALAENGSAPLTVDVRRADGHKCDRCWNYSSEVGSNSDYPTLCERCVPAVEEILRSAGNG